MTLENILTTIIENFVNLVPIRKVHSYQQGVKFSWGKDVKLLKTGVYAYFPFFQSIEVEETVLQVVDTDYQSLMTKDQIPVTLSTSVAYKINDARKYWTSIQSQDDSIINITKGTIARQIHKHNYSAIHKNPNELEKETKKELQKNVKNWGIHIKDLFLADFIKTKNYRFITTKEMGVKE